MKCSECQFFNLDQYAHYNKGFGICMKSGSDNGYPDDETSLSYASDGESYVAELRVSPNFGCVQFVQITQKGSL